MENPCKKCKHFIPSVFGRYAYYPEQCSRKVFKEYNPINGEWMSNGYLDIYEERLTNSPECCGTEGKFFERKEGFFKRIARAVHLLK